ncbi:MAG: DUF1501 domain-containing protein, partial [Phycisphaerales bacterium]|nr:DUF1501 domain-containing protein [Phycisphaerales bacterium]
WTGRDVHPDLVRPYDTLSAAGVTDGVDASSNAAFLMRTTMDAQIASVQIRKAVEMPSLVRYPTSGLARQLSMIANMIRAGLPTRVYYATLGGFDTHAGQGGAQGSHANLMRTFSDAMLAFYQDLKAQENDRRVLTMSFSEFGRRVRQNASGGTDHGTAAPLFLFGPMVKAGILGNHPSLRDLDNGDLKYQIDFRAIYAGILEQWLQADSKEVLEGRFRAADVIRSA